MNATLSNGLRKLRLAWLGDPEWEDTYSAREARVLLRMFARSQDILPLWFAVGRLGKSHFWNGVRVFPMPSESLVGSGFLADLVEQQRPDMIVSHLPHDSLLHIRDYLTSRGIPWIHRATEEDANAGHFPPASIVLVPGDGVVGESNARVVPFISGLTGAPHAGAGVADVYESLRAALKEVGRSPRSKADANGACLVMRQHLFCNISLSHVMFELTNSLLELGVPTIPQAQQGDLTPSHIVLEEELYRTGTGDKYERVFKHVHTDYDPEKAITLHFTMLKMGGAYPALSGREALYVTGNAQGASRESVRQLTSSFEKILGVSPFVLWPFVQAGLGSTQAAIIPHGVDPELFNPERRPTAYPTKKRFKFLETSFPWINEKGFDLTIRAFGQAFSSTDDVCLMLRVPCVTDLSKRKQTFDRLETLVRDELSKPRAPEILLVESNVELDRRGGIYTAADCYVHPSRSEGFGMTILEAMACGLPVISTAWAGPAEFVSARWAYPVRHSPPPSQATGNGTWRCMPVEPELDHLVYLMRHVYSHRNEAKALGRKAAAVVRDRWTWKHAAIKLAELFSLPYSSQPSVNNYTGPPT